MPRVLIVYCSMTGNTKAAAEAIAEGAQAAGAQVTLKTGTEAQPEDLLECDAVAWGSYDAFHYMGGGLKDFCDRAFYPTQGQVTDKPYAAFLTHGGRGRAIEGIESIAQYFKLSRSRPPGQRKGKVAKDPSPSVCCPTSRFSAKAATHRVGFCASPTWLPSCRRGEV